MGKIDSEKKLIELMNQYKNLVFSVCLKMTGDYFAAEDITQETFISAYQHLDKFDGTAEKAWLCRIATNKCIDYMRAAERRAIATEEDEMPQESTQERDGPLQSFVNKDVLVKFRDDCNALPEPYREVAEDYFINELTAKEIAEKRGKPLKTVQTHIYRARDMLKKTMRKEDLLA